MAEETKKTETVEKTEPVEYAFTKKQILKSRKYARWVDWLKANLKEDKKYTHGELSAMIGKAFKVTIK